MSVKMLAKVQFRQCLYFGEEWTGNPSVTHDNILGSQNVVGIRFSFSVNKLRLAAGSKESKS